MADARRIEEALAHIKAAEKALKTSLLKWQPDHEIACDAYQQAATCYRNAKRYDECRACLMKAADCHLQTRSLFHAAKCYEQVILMMREQGALADIEALAHRACKLYQQQGSPEAGASALDKAAKIVESQLPEHALNLYRHALEVAQLEDHSRQASEYACKVSRILVRLQRYDDAAEALSREIALSVQTESGGVVGRLTVALVLVQLAREDSIAATKVFRQYGAYCDANEQITLDQLLNAYDDEDPEAAKRALRSPFIMHMDVEYARLAREIPLPEGMPVSVAPVAAASAAVAAAAAAAASAGAASAAASSLFDEEEDEEPAKPVQKDVENVTEQLAKKSMFDEDDEDEDEEHVAPKPTETVKPAEEEDDDDDEGLC